MIAVSDSINSVAIKINFVAIIITSIIDVAIKTNYGGIKINSVAIKSFL